MKMIIVVALALAAVAVAAPAEPAEIVPIIRSEFEREPEGGYKFSYESGDGSKRQETGEPKEALDEENKPHTVIVVRGSYAYIDDAGNPQTIEYTADENGYKAVGPAIPVAPARR